MPFHPFVPNATFLYPLKTLENFTVFWCFQGVEKSALGMNGLKKLFIDDWLIYLFTDLLCGALTLKDQNLNPLWTDLICSKLSLSRQLHFFRDGQFVHQILHLHFHYPRLQLPLQVAHKIQKQSIYQTMVEIGWFQVESVLLGTLNWIATSLLGLFLSNSFSASYFALKVTLLCFLFMVILNTIHKQFSFMH